VFQDCQSILRDAPIGIFTSTVAGRFVAVNPAMAAMYGYDSPEQMIWHRQGAWR
jgi:PAS domain S-box-containing protein